MLKCKHFKCIEFNTTLKLASIVLVYFCSADVDCSFDSYLVSHFIYILLCPKKCLRSLLWIGLEIQACTMNYFKLLNFTICIQREIVILEW